MKIVSGYSGGTVPALHRLPLNYDVPEMGKQYKNGGEVVKRGSI